MSPRLEAPLRAPGRRAVGALLAIVLAVLAVPLLAGPASAAEDFHGRLRNAGEPVAGVRIAVTTPAGDPVGEDVTDDNGEWAVPLPGPGDYEITLDTATLPEGVELRDEDAATAVRDVGANQLKTQLFLLGERETTESDVNRTAQLAVEGLRFGLLLALAAVGLSLIYGTTGLVNFAQGELVTLGALVTYYVNVHIGLHLLAAAPIAIVACAVAGYLQDRLFWGRLRRRGTGLVALMIISIGVAILVRYIYLYFYGGGTNSFEEYRGQAAVQAGSLPVALPPRDYWSIGIAAVALLVVIVALNRTRWGKAMRAVADNPSLARASGIDVDRVIRLVWVVGTVLAGLAGILLGVAQQVNFTMGVNILLLLFAAVVLGGLGSATGAVLGALIIGLCIQLSTRVIPVEMKDVGGLAVLILILLIRPQGILGRAERVG